MGIPFSCPHCHLETMVDEEFAGQTGACAGCGKQITVPFLTDSRTRDPAELVVGIPHRRRSIWGILVAVVGAAAALITVVVVAGYLLFPAAVAIRSRADQNRCTDNLERIAQALQLYEADHGSLPPAYIADENGLPKHSWRVLILPYLDEGGLHARYDFSQPWNSPQNIQLTALMPEVYACPADPDSTALGESNYVVVVGSDTLFPGAEPRSTSQVIDHLRTTLAVVETPARGTPWTQPADLSTASMQFVINGEFSKEIGSRHRHGAHALMADGTVQLLHDLIPEDYVAAMATIDGGEPIPDDVLDSVGDWE